MRKNVQNIKILFITGGRTHEMDFDCRCYYCFNYLMGY